MLDFSEPQIVVVAHDTLVYNNPREMKSIDRLRSNDLVMTTKVSRECKMVWLADGGCVPLKILRPLLLHAGDFVATCPVVEIDCIAR